MQYCPIKKTCGMAVVGLVVIFVGCQGSSFAGTESSDSPVRGQSPAERPAESEPIAEEPAEVPVPIAGANLLSVCEEADRVQLSVEIGCILRNRERPEEKLSNIDWNYEAGQEIPGSEIEVDLTPEHDDFDVIYRISASNGKDLKTLLSRFRILIAYEGAEIAPEITVREDLSSEDDDDDEKTDMVKSKNPKANDN